jgi:hypothetical protein
MSPSSLEDNCDTQGVIVARKFVFLAVALAPTLHIMGCAMEPARGGIVRGFLNGPRLPNYAMDYTLVSSNYYGDVGIVSGFLSVRP